MIVDIADISTAIVTRMASGLLRTFRIVVGDDDDDDDDDNCFVHFQSIVYHISSLTFL